MSSNSTPKVSTQTNWFGLVNLLIVYIVWGSTYLAIRIGVREGSGFPPLFLAGTRVLVAGFILLGLALLQKKRIKLAKREFILLVTSGVMLWLGGNGMVVFAEQHVDSGIAALIIGSTPLGVALMEFIIDRRPPSPLMIISMLDRLCRSGFAICTRVSIRSAV